MEWKKEDYLQMICKEQPYKLVISNPVNRKAEFRKIVIHLFQQQGRFRYQIEKFTEKQAFHINIEVSDLYEILLTYFGPEYLQIGAWTTAWEYQGKISRQGKLLQNRRRNSEEEQIRTGNNKEKNYCIPEGIVIPPLVDMGIFTKEGKVVRSKYDKYRQINRYLELVEDVLKELPEGQLNIIDFGCGKSYLTFLLYYYLVEVKKLQVTMTGLDLKEDVIRTCRETAEKYHYDNLKFELGDIHGYQTSKPVHMVITLHACDTATDYALYHAIQWRTKVILSVPCCQHEWNRQMHGQQLSILSRYGIIKERTAALMTDAVRGNLLEYCGYRTQLLEFIDLEHSPKNILIRAVRTSSSESRKQEALREAEEIIDTFNVNPALYQLTLKKEKEDERESGKE